LVPVFLFRGTLMVFPFLAGPFPLLYYTVGGKLFSRIRNNNSLNNCLPAVS
jgi:hypothetical protein